ncbi:MAG TPA: cupin domain-containing protein [Terriglobales bacterium]|nr:cupin domain-containing protein [Terriglobales bacterium]
MKMRRMLLLTCIMCLAASTVLAQDVMSVAGGPETHKVILDNDRVRVLDVRIQPGQKIAMHSHPVNTVYFVNDSKLKVTLPDGKTAVREGKAGTAVWNDATTHAVENVGTSELHLVQTEMKGTAK